MKKIENKEKLQNKFYRIAIDTYVSGMSEYFVFFTESCYYDADQISVQVDDAVRKLNLPHIANIIITIREASEEECKDLPPIETAYKPLKKYIKGVAKKVEVERLRRMGVKCINLVIFLQRIFDASLCDEER